MLNTCTVVESHGAAAANATRKLFWEQLFPGTKTSAPEGNSGGGNNGTASAPAVAPTGANSTSEGGNKSGKSLLERIFEIPFPARGGGGIPAATPTEGQALIPAAPSETQPPADTVAPVSVPVATVRSREFERLLERMSFAKGVRAENAGVKSMTTITRAQAIDALLRSLDIPLDTIKSSAFSDLRVTSPYAPAMTTAVRLGLIQGNNDEKTVRPYDPITREELTIIINRLQREGLMKTARTQR